MKIEPVTLPDGRKAEFCVGCTEWVYEPGRFVRGCPGSGIQPSTHHAVVTQQALEVLDARRETV